MKEKLKRLREELASLKAKVEEQDEEAMKRASEILEKEIPEVEAQIKKSEDAKSLIAKIGTSAPAAKGTGVSAKSLGDFAAKHLAGKAERGVRISSLATPEFKASSDVQTIPTTIQPALTTYDRNIYGYHPELTIASLFGSENISGNALTYWVEGALEGTASTVAENGQKPQIHFANPTAVTENLTKIAAFYKESDEILEDAQWMVSSINNRALYNLRAVEEAQLLNGNGTAPNLTGILNRSGLQTKEYDSALSADDIFAAMMLIKQNSGFAADAIVINPADYQTLRLAKDSNNQYYGGGYFTGQYGNGALAEVPAIWGVKTVLSNSVSAGTVLVGNFKSASIIRKGGIRVEMTNSDDKDFELNRVAVRIEERLALAVRYPAAFCKIVKKTVTPGG